MGYPYTAAGKSYWIVTTTSTHIPGGKTVDESKNEPTIFRSRPVQGTGKFRPGEFLQHACREFGETGAQQNWSYAIVSVVETTREDLEAYCLDFDYGRWMVDIDERSAYSRSLAVEKF